MFFYIKAIWYRDLRASVYFHIVTRVNYLMFENWFWCNTNSWYVKKSVDAVSLNNFIKCYVVETYKQWKDILQYLQLSTKSWLACVIARQYYFHPNKWQFQSVIDKCKPSMSEYSYFLCQKCIVSQLSIRVHTWIISFPLNCSFCNDLRRPGFKFFFF